jgi:hypothetical protein
MPSKTKSRKVEPFESSKDWYAGCLMAVWREVHGTDDRFHPPLKPFLQLLLYFWDDHESWTLYHDPKHLNKAGKIVIKRWDVEADQARFRALNGKPAPTELKKKPTIHRHELTLPSLWIRSFTRELTQTAIIPLTKSNRSRKRTKSDLTHQINFWSGANKVTYSWLSAPPEWKALERLLSKVIGEFKQ